MSLARIPSRAERLTHLQNETGTDLSSIDAAFVDDEDLPHCENMIGAVTIPVGVAGPLLITNDKLRITNSEKKQNYYVPLATTEGALVASVNRGCKITREAGGVTVHVVRKGASRGPVFQTRSIENGHQLVSFINENTEQIRAEAEKTSQHLRVLNIVPKVVGPYVFLRCSYDTDDAMGMNMVTIASQRIAQYIETHADARCLSVAGNYDIDKKPAWLNMINGRGFEAWADIDIPAQLVQDILKITPHKIFDVWLGKCMVGSAMSGSLGYNSHYANIIAALYAATGQDIAHTVEGSLGITVCSIKENGDLSVSVYLPSLMLGIVGGGTKLKTQQEALSVIGVTSSEELAHVVAGTVLAGELSLLASLAEGSLAKAHKKLGR